jgi:hypothetical protein
MRRVLSLTTFCLLFWACVSTPPAPPRVPDMSPAPDSTPGAAPRLLKLEPGTVVYAFTQTSEIRPEQAIDTARAGVVVTALLTVRVTPQADSLNEILVSADSVRIATTGSVAPRTQHFPGLPISLGPVIRAVLGPNTRSLHATLADSLCEYGQLVNAAREVILFALPHSVPLTEQARWADSSQFSTCRAGTTVQTYSLLDISYSRSRPNELLLRSTGTILGGGRMRSDSVNVRGTVQTTGQAMLEADTRLPAFVHTESSGTVTVSLGDSTTVFRQQSTQEWIKRPPN